MKPPKISDVRSTVSLNGGAEMSLREFAARTEQMGSLVELVTKCANGLKRVSNKLLKQVKAFDKRKGSKTTLFFLENNESWQMIRKTIKTTPDIMQAMCSFVFFGEKAKFEDVAAELKCDSKPEFNTSGLELVAKHLLQALETAMHRLQALNESFGNYA